MNKPDQPGSPSTCHAAICDLYDKFADGNTIVVNALHTFWGPICELCVNMTSELGFKTKANMYITPKNTMGFSPHWDDHDVMILQISGKKRWRIYGNGPELPRKSDQDILAAKNQRTLKPGDPLFEMIMAPGDFLYLPRGWVHNAMAMDTTSVHITLGLTPCTFEDLLIAGIQAKSKQCLAFRKSIPVGSLVKRVDCLTGFQKDCDGLLAQLQKEFNLDAALNLLKQKLISTQEPLPSGHFCQMELLDTLDIETMVTRRTKTIVLYIEEPDYVALIWPSHFQQGPVKMNLAFDFIANNPSFRIGEIPGWYSDNEKCITVRHLIKKGLLKLG